MEKVDGKILQWLARLLPTTKGESVMVGGKFRRRMQTGLEKQDRTKTGEHRAQGKRKHPNLSTQNKSNHKIQNV